MALYAPKFTQGLSYVSSTTPTSTASASYVVMSGMVVTLAPLVSGVYLVMFSASGACSSNTSNAVYGIHFQGTLVAGSERSMNDTGGTQSASMFTAMHCHALHLYFPEVVSGDIDVRYKTEAGTFSVRSRSLIVIPQVAIHTL